MKRTTKHMKKTLAYIEKAWRKYPELRLCQLLGNLVPSGCDIYYMDDAELIIELKKHEKFWDKGGYTAWKKVDTGNSAD